MEIRRILSFAAAAPAFTSRARWDARTSECRDLRAVEGAKQALRQADKDLNLVKSNIASARSAKSSAFVGDDGKTRLSLNNARVYSAANAELRAHRASRPDLAQAYYAASKAYPMMPWQALAWVYSVTGVVGGAATAVMVQVAGFQPLDVVPAVSAAAVIGGHSAYLFRTPKTKKAREGRKSWRERRAERLDQEFGQE